MGSKAIRWVAGFSQSGTEIVELSKRLNRSPNLIFTNNRFDWNPEIKTLGSGMLIDTHHSLMNTLLSMQFDTESTLITLHGYLRIIPPVVCDRYNIYNGHPAPIHLYPELKGKDKQAELYYQKAKYARIGSVVHKVIAELDAGEIVSQADAENQVESIDDAFNHARALSSVAWYNFLKDRV
jgi:hypothetical protein